MATADIGRRDDIAQSVVSQRVNMAYFEVAHAIEAQGLERIAVSSTTSGENRIDLPTDYGEFINASVKWSWSTASSTVSSTKTLSRMNASEADALGFLPVGEPQGFVLYNNWMELWPSPDSAYSLQLRYRSMVTDMIQTSDVPSVSTPYRQAILFKAEEHLHRYVGNFAAAAALNQTYIDYMARTKSDEYRRQLGEVPMGLRPVYGTHTRSRSTS